MFIIPLLDAIDNMYCLTSLDRKVLKLSLLAMSGIPRRAIKRLNPRKNPSIDMFMVSSKGIARLDAQVNRSIYTLSLFELFFTYRGPAKSRPFW